MSDDFKISNDGIWRLIIGFIFLIASAAVAYSIRLDAKLAGVEEKYNAINLTITSVNNSRCTDTQCDNFRNAITVIEQKIAQLPAKGEVPQWLLNDISENKARITANERAIWPHPSATAPKKNH